MANPSSLCGAARTLDALLPLTSRSPRKTYSDAIAASDEVSFKQQLAKDAASEIVRIAMLEQVNFDQAYVWREDFESGWLKDPVNGAADLPDFKDLQCTQTFEVEVRDAHFLDHLIVGFRWETAMYALDGSSQA